MEKAKTWARGSAQRALKIDFVRFFMVGSIGFTLTAASLKLFHDTLGMHITPATFISSEIGLLSNFFFHLHWTYKRVDHSHKSAIKKFMHFHMSSWTGVVLITVLESIGVELLHLNYFLSLVGAAGIAMFWNFFWTKYYIFRGKTPGVLLQPEDASRDDG